MAGAGRLLKNGAMLIKKDFTKASRTSTASMDKNVLKNAVNNAKEEVAQATGSATLGPGVTGLMHGPANIGNIEGAGFFDVSGQVLSNMGSRLTSKFGDGWGIAKAAGKHALKGAVAGAAIEGTSEWAQGGSFWTGAKSGAFDGAVGWAGYRMLGHSVGATTRNPFGRDGAIGQLTKNYSNMSKQAKVMMENKARAATASAANGLNKK